MWEAREKEEEASLKLLLCAGLIVHSALWGTQAEHHLEEQGGEMGPGNDAKARDLSTQAP